MNGFFIVLEGPDLSGKTTQVSKLYRHLDNIFPSQIVKVRDPGSTPTAEKIRDIVKSDSNDPVCSDAELLLFAAARAQLVNFIRSRLNEDKLVICDRYIWSTWAYQHHGRGHTIADVAATIEIAVRGLLPNVLFVLDVSPHVAMSRQDMRGTPDKFETDSDFVARVADGYRGIDPACPMIRFSGDNEINDLHHQMVRVLPTFPAFTAWVNRHLTSSCPAVGSNSEN